MQHSEHARIAALYQRSVLDIVVEIALAVSHDFLKRPRHYRNIPDNIARKLEGFRIRTGSDPEWLSAIQRATLFAPIFGAEFSGGSIGLRTASLAFAERGFKDNTELLDRVRDTAAAFRGILKSIEGRTISEADRETVSVFQSAFEVLQSEAVARVFGLPSAPDEDWPLAWKEAAASFDGAYLIEEIQRALNLSYIRPAMTQHRFILLQRVAHYGALTIGGVLDDVSSDDKFCALARNAYGWEKVLQELLSRIDVVRAWKDPKYRQNLSGCEKSMIDPHPSGEVDLKDTQLDPTAARMRIGPQLPGMTYSIVAICCSTGNLPCPDASQGSAYCCPTNTGFTCPTTECGSGCTIIT